MSIPRVLIMYSGCCNGPELALAQDIPKGGFREWLRSLAAQDMIVFLGTEAMVALRIAVEQEPDERHADGHQAGRHERGLPAPRQGEPDHQGRCDHGPDRAAGGDPAGRDRTLLGWEPDGRGLDRGWYGARFGNAQQCPKAGHRLPAAGESVERARQAPGQGEDEEAEPQLEKVDHVTGDGLHEGVTEPERRDYIGILLRREMQLILELGRQDSQDIAVQIVDDRAHRHKGQDVPPQAFDFGHRFLLG
jgi:hypothetical protein